MQIEEIKRIISAGTEEEKDALKLYFAKYGNTSLKEEEVHEILVNVILQLTKEETIQLSGIIGYPVFLRICLVPKIRHAFPLLQDGAALVIYDDENRVLVQERMDNGKFGFSGGCQELGEELKSVGIRECLEETGLEADISKVKEVCEVSGLSRKNAYPNGDVVVNNTALYVANLKDTTGTIHVDLESKQVGFKPLSFLYGLSKEQLHDADFIAILDSLLHGKEITLTQPKIEAVTLPEKKNDETFADYLSTLTSEQSLYLAKKMGYENFLYNSIDERIRDVFPHLVDKSILIATNGDNILVNTNDGKYSLPKVSQSVGDSFENIMEETYRIPTNNLQLFMRVSGQKTYNSQNNTFTNAMIFVPKKTIEPSDRLVYIPISKIEESLDSEDILYLSEFFLQKETNFAKSDIK